ncbi:MAG: hypothetical protein N3B21_10980 [Clostridia bacterium]|nr:hypothetical protein [Clostridia bacterium]
MVRKILFKLFLTVLVVTTVIAAAISTAYAQNSWTQKAGLSTARYSLKTAEVDGKIYAIGGLNTAAQSIVEEYDPIANKWTTKTPMTAPRYALEVAAANGKIYAIGGNNSSGSIVSTIEEYDPTLDKWTTKTAMPTSRHYMVSASVNGKIYVIGGANGTQLNKVEEYNPVTDAWTTKASMPTARSGMAAVVHNGKIYVIGGLTGNTTYTNIVEVYDPIEDKWTSKALMPTIKGYMGAGEINGKIYVVGGYNSSGRLGAVEEYNPLTDTWITKPTQAYPRYYFGASTINDKMYIIGGYDTAASGLVEEYYPSEDTWTAKNPMPYTRYGASVVALNGKIYTISGETSLNSYTYKMEEYNFQTSTYYPRLEIFTARKQAGVAAVNGKIYVIGGFNGSYLKKVEEYDPETHLWTPKADMPTARSQLKAVVVNGKIYAIGGYNGSSTLNTVEEYDPVSDTWTTKTGMPTLRRLFGLDTVNGKVYAIGGYSSSYLNTVEVYDPVNDAWSTRAPMPTNRSSLEAVSVGGKIYAIGGANGSTSYLNALEEYDPATNTWTTRGKMPTAREGIGAAALGNKIYVMGGYNGYYLNTVEEYTVAQSLLPAPINLKAVLSGNSAAITWDTVAGATAYDLEADGSIIENITNTTYTHSGLSQGTNHTYRVRAKNSLSTSDWSSSVSLQIPSVPLDIPANLKATVTGNTVTVSWDAVTGATSYDITADGTVVDNGSSTTYTRSNLTAGTHTYTVRAKNSTSTGEWSNPVSCLVAEAIVGVPSNITATATEFSITVKWDSLAEAVGYDIEADGQVINNGVNTTYLADNLMPNTTHIYRVRARTQAGIGNWSSPITGTTLNIGDPMPLIVPGNITATVSGTSIIIKWDSVTGATGYDIEVDGEVRDGGSSTSYTHANLTPGVQHTYRVRARNTIGTSNWSEAITKNISSNTTTTIDVNKFLSTLTTQQAIDAAQQKIDSAKKYMYLLSDESLKEQLIRDITVLQEAIYAAKAKLKLLELGF